MSRTTSGSESISTPEQIESRLGAFGFPPGFPIKDTVTSAYDQLDIHHALDAYFNGLAAVSLYAIRKGLADIGVNDGDVLIFNPRRSEGFHYYDDSDSNWFSPLFAGGYDFLAPPPSITKDGIKPFPNPNARKLNGRASFFPVATGITRAMCMRLTGIGRQYLLATVDSAGAVLDGGKNYTPELPEGIPAERFWSAIVYDNQTRSLLDTAERFPRAGS